MNLSFEQPLHYGRLHCQGNDFLFRNSQKSKLPDNNQFQPDMSNKTGTGTFKLLYCTVDIEHCQSYIHHTLVQVMKDEWDMKVGRMLTNVNIFFHHQQRRPYKKLASITFSTLLHSLVKSNCDQ